MFMKFLVNVPMKYFLYLPTPHLSNVATFDFHTEYQSWDRRKNTCRWLIITKHSLKQWGMSFFFCYFFSQILLNNICWSLRLKCGKLHLFSTTSFANAPQNWNSFRKVQTCLTIQYDYIYIYWKTHLDHYHM